MELHGRGYVIDHCIAAFRREEKQRAEDRLFRLYITDALQAITENTTHHIVQGVDHAIDYGKSLRLRYADLLDQVEGKTKPEPEPEPDDRSAQEIVSDMWRRIRGGPKQEQK